MKRSNILCNLTGALGAEMIDEPVSFPKFGVGNCLPPTLRNRQYNIAPENRSANRHNSDRSIGLLC